MLENQFSLMKEDERFERDVSYKMCGGLSCCLYLFFIYDSSMKEGEKFERDISYILTLRKSMSVLICVYGCCVVCKKETNRAKHNHDEYA